jgi:hypothetical protein
MVWAKQNKQPRKKKTVPIYKTRWSLFSRVKNTLKN